MVVKGCNRQFGHETIHPTKKNYFYEFVANVLLDQIGILIFDLHAKLYIPITLNIDLILLHTQFIVCAENVKSWFKSWVFSFTFQAYILPHTLNCMCFSQLRF